MSNGIVSSMYDDSFGVRILPLQNRLPFRASAERAMATDTLALVDRVIRAEFRYKDFQDGRGLPEKTEFFERSFGGSDRLYGLFIYDWAQAVVRRVGKELQAGVRILPQARQCYEDNLAHTPLCCPEGAMKALLESRGFNTFCEFDGLEFSIEGNNNFFNTLAPGKPIIHEGVSILTPADLRERYSVAS